MTSRDYYQKQRRYSRERQAPNYSRHERPRYSQYRSDRYLSNRTSGYPSKKYRYESYQYNNDQQSQYPSKSNYSSYHSYNRKQEGGGGYFKKDIDYNKQHKDEQDKYQHDTKKYQGDSHLQDKKRIERKMQNHKVTCPFLVRTFLTKNFPVQVEEFTLDGKVPKIGEAHIYCWGDSNLRDIIDLLKYPITQLRASNIETLIYSIYISPQGKFIRKKLGNIQSEKRGGDDFSQLQNNQFKPGDFLNVVIFDKEKQQEKLQQQQQLQQKQKGNEKKKVQGKEDKSQVNRELGQVKQRRDDKNQKNQ